MSTSNTIEGFQIDVPSEEMVSILRKRATKMREEAARIEGLRVQAAEISSAPRTTDIAPNITANGALADLARLCNMIVPGDAEEVADLMYRGRAPIVPPPHTRHSNIDRVAHARQQALIEGADMLDFAASHAIRGAVYRMDVSVLAGGFLSRPHHRGMVLPPLPSPLSSDIWG